MGARMGQLLIAHQLIFQLLPVFDLNPAAPGIFIQGDLVFFDQLRMVFPDKIRHEFGVVFAGFRDITAELLHDFKTDQIIMLLRRKLIIRIQQLRIILQHFFRIGFVNRAFLCAPFDFRIIVLSVPRDLQQPGHMIDSCYPVLHMILGQSQPVKQLRHTHLNGMADSNRPYGGCPEHGHCEHGHGIRIV